MGLLYALAANKTSSSFTPTDIPNMKLWLDGNDQTTFNGGSITTGTGVSSWADKSGNGYVWSQATTLRQPIWTANLINSKAAVVFLNQVLVPSTEQYVNTGQPFEVIAIFRIITDHSTNNNDMLFLANNSANHTVGMGYRGNSVGIELFGDGTHWAYGACPQTLDVAGSYHFYQWQYNGSGATTRSNFNIFYDRTDLGNIDTNSTANGDTTSSFLGNYFNGSDPLYGANIGLAALLIYQTLFSAGQQTSINNWVNTTYGI